MVMSAKEIIEQHPLSLDYSEDGRYVWPKRWKLLQAENEKLKALITDRPSQEDYDGLMFIKNLAESKMTLAETENAKLKKRAKAVSISLEFMEKQARAMQEHLCLPTE